MKVDKVAVTLPELLALIDRHAKPRGAPTAVPRQHLVSESGAVDRRDLTYTPMVCIVASGAKHVDMGSTQHVVSVGHVFLGLLDAPVLATFQTPYRSVALRLDDAVIAAVLADPATPPIAPADEGGTAFPYTRADGGLVRAFARWVSLLDEPEHISALAPAAEAEIIYRLLVGPLGPRLRAVVATPTVARLRDAIRYLYDNYARAVSVAELAEVAAMSPASLHRHFKQMTGQTPGQLQRAIRLQQARRLLVGSERTAASVAGAVGYLSPSQFSRDYRDRYGLSPRRDAVRLRSGNGLGDEGR